MRRSTVLGVLPTLAVLTAALSTFAQSSHASLGTWKLNLAKSKYSLGPPPRSATLKREAVEGGFVKEPLDGVDAQGQATHTEVILKFDGKDYPVKGGQGVNPTRAVKRIDDRTTETTETTGKADGKVGLTTRTAVSPDGKTITGTQTGKNAQGQTVSNVVVRDKQ